MELLEAHRAHLDEDLANPFRRRPALQLERSLRLLRSDGPGAHQHLVEAIRVALAAGKDRPPVADIDGAVVKRAGAAQDAGLPPAPKLHHRLRERRGQRARGIAARRRWPASSLLFGYALDDAEAEQGVERGGRVVAGQIRDAEDLLHALAALSVLDQRQHRALAFGQLQRAEDRVRVLRALQPRHQGAHQRFEIGRLGIHPPHAPVHQIGGEHIELELARRGGQRRTLAEGVQPLAPAEGLEDLPEHLPEDELAQLVVLDQPRLDQQLRKELLALALARGPLQLFQLLGGDPAAREQGGGDAARRRGRTHLHHVAALDEEVLDPDARTQRQHARLSGAVEQAEAARQRLDRKRCLAGSRPQRRRRQIGRRRLGQQRQHLLHVQADLLRREWLGEKEVGAELHRLGRVAVDATEDQHRRQPADRGLLDALADLQSVEARQDHVEQDQVRHQLGKFIQGIDAVFAHDRRVAGIGGHELEHLGDPGVVVDDEDLAAGGSHLP